MATSLCPLSNRRFQLMGLCSSTVAQRPSLNGSRAFANSKKPSPSNFCLPLKRQPQQKSNTHSLSPKASLSVNQKSKINLFTWSTLLVFHSGLWESGQSVPKAVVQDGLGEQWSAQMMLAFTRTIVTKSSDLQTSGPVQIFHVLYGK